MKKMKEKMFVFLVDKNDWTNKNGICANAYYPLISSTGLFQPQISNPNKLSWVCTPSAKFDPPTATF